jgi:hypothetical protein
MVIRLTMLPDNVPHAQIMDEKFEQIGLCRILSHRSTMDLIPNLLPGASRLCVDGSNNPEVTLAVSVNPFDKEP